MHTALVMFKGQSVPVIFGLSNSGNGKNLATMDNVEWVQVISPTGYVLRYDNGAAYPDNIAPIKPEAKPTHVCPEPVNYTNGLSSFQAGLFARCLVNNQKVLAIKIYREAFNVTLVEAKRQISAMIRDLHNQVSFYSQSDNHQGDYEPLF